MKVSYADIEVGLDCEGAPGLADNGDLEHDLQELLESAGRAAKAAGTALMIFIDELQYVPQAQLAALITAMHRCAQRKVPVLLVGAGLPQLRGRMGEAKSYAERLFEFPEIGPLSADAAIQAITKPIRAEGARHLQRSTACADSDDGPLPIIGAPLNTGAVSMKEQVRLVLRVAASAKWAAGWAAMWAACLAATAAVQAAAAAQPVVSVSFPASRSAAPLDGRVILLMSRDFLREPRTHVAPNMPLDTPFLFGLNVDALAPGKAAVLDDRAFGWPARRLSVLPAGDYFAQAVLNRYETFHLADGRVLKLPPDRGEGQQWALKPGNLYSTPVRVHWDPVHPRAIRLTLDQEIPPITPKPDTEFVRHVRIRSELLSRFWGRDMYLGAHVLLPKDFDAHPQARFPLMVFHGHFPYDLSGFRTTPPDPDLKPVYSERFHLAGYNRIEQQEAYAFYQKWISADFPRFLVVEIQHANPYYDDSYAVNSANLGPYGDAINQELIPEIEKRFRGLGQGWARFTYGGSTGGWEALATQVFYPDMYNGAFAACPDPIDFRAYTVVNLYQDANAYTLTGEASKVERPGFRNYLGEVFATQRDMNHAELAQGDRSRSGGQYDIWQAVYSPVGADGYPQPIFDKIDGRIDPTVAAYWREHYDLSHIIERDWATLAPKLQGKMHLYVGSGDNYYLTNSVYFAQERLESLVPAYGGEVRYGDRAEHCWNGDPALPNAYSRLHYNFQYVPKILERIQASAPPGADLTSWRY